MLEPQLLLIHISQCLLLRHPFLRHNANLWQDHRMKINNNGITILLKDSRPSRIIWINLVKDREIILHNTDLRNLLLKQISKRKSQKILACQTMQVQIFCKKPHKLTKCFQIYLTKLHGSRFHKFKVKILLQKSGMLRKVNSRMTSKLMKIPIYLAWKFKKILVKIWAKARDS